MFSEFKTVYICLMNRVEINLLNTEVMTICGHLAVHLQIIYPEAVTL